MKFSYFISKCSYKIDVYSILKASTFLFGHNLSDKILSDFSTSWKKHLPGLDLSRMEDFSLEEIKELMGRHEVIIRTRFKYPDDSLGEITLPYAPIFALSQVAAKSS